jgi:osmoprotectant transport system substrate-binding protein
MPGATLHDERGGRARRFARRATRQARSRGPACAIRATAAIVLTAGWAVACSPSGPETSPPQADDGAVTVASFDFSESVVLAEIYSQALADGGIPVRRELNLGPREVVAPALGAGLVDAVPEYVGTALAEATGEEDLPTDAAVAHRRLRDVYADRGLRLLEPAPAQSQNGIVVSRLTAVELGLDEVSDLQPVAGGLVFGGPPECGRRPYCLLGLESVYGLSFKDVLTLDTGGPLTVSALRAGEVDVALLFTSDGHLGSPDLVLLRDDRSLQPAENIVPVVRQEIVDRYGAELVARLDRVSGALSTDDLVDLNAAVALEDRAPAAVAAEWLSGEGLLD